jgi:two-component system, response regulator PdtaR
MPKKSAELTETTPKKTSILVVDDDEMVIAFLTTVLESANYTVVNALSGEEALQLLLSIENEPDLALLDINMTGMSGLELAKNLRDETAVPFMFLSLLADDDVIKTASEYGAVGYLVKPVEPEQILSALAISLARADEIKRLRNSEKSLTTALETGRETSMAVGILMERFQISRMEAFDKLRSEARRNRMKLTLIANATLLSVESQLGVEKTVAKVGDKVADKVGDKVGNKVVEIN